MTASTNNPTSDRDHTSGPAVKVSVVVPVYNPGPYIEDLIASLLRQSLPAEEFEAIFVDDGSTDDSPARLDALAAEHPHMKVIHQENSGWSGKPRNVGIDAARGEYVFFADNDDWLGDEALERLYDFAKKNDADIVVGKMAGKGRGVPRELFRRNYDRATLANAPLIDSLTPHKLFRKAFLDEHKLRFPEGRRRLEDHVFVTAAYFAARTISVLSDYVCYYHVRRDDNSNAGFQRLEPKGYFANLAEALDIVEENTEPGPLRDRLYRRWYRVEMIERLRGRRLLQMPDADRQALFEEIRRLSSERFGPGVTAGLPPTQRVVGRLVQADRLKDLMHLAAWEEDIGARVRLDDLGWHDAALRLVLTGELRAGAGPVTFTHRDGRDLLTPPLPEDALAVIPEEDLDSTARLAQSRLDVLVRSRETSAEFHLPVTFTPCREPIDGSDERFRLLLRGEARLDVVTVGGTAPLANGIWDVVARISTCGWTKDTRVGSIRLPSVSDHCVPAVLGDPPRVVTPYWTDKGNLSLDVGQRTSRLGGEVLTGDQPSLRTDASGLGLCIPLRAVVAQPVTDAAVRLVHEASGHSVDASAELAPAVSDGAGCSELRAWVGQALEPGRWSVQVRLVGAGQGRFVGVPASVTVPARGGKPAVEALRRPDEGPDEPSEPGMSPRSAEFVRALRVGRRLARKVRHAVTGAVRRASS